MNAVDAVTPEFLRWSFDADCALRTFCPPGDPEQVERHLKTLRAIAECRAAGRTRAGLCFHESLDRRDTAPPVPTGFREIDALAAYGGATFDERTCGECVVHVDREGGPVRLAGCFGLVDWRPVADELFASSDETLIRIASAERRAELFLPTRPGWRGLWAQSPLAPEPLALLRELVATLTEQGAAWRDVFGRFLTALDVAIATGRSLHVAYGPSGRLVGRGWIVDPHCSRCKAPREMTSRVCECCGLDARPLPPRRRLGRGSRPYRPLTEFLGAAALRDVLEPYLAERGWAPGAIAEYFATLGAPRATSRGGQA